MDLMVITQLTFVGISFFTTLVLVIIPRKILNSNSRFEKNYRLLDLTNYFSMGVFSATCFIVLLPHVLVSFIKAISIYKWTDVMVYKTILSVSMAGFIFIFGIEKLCKYCQGGGGRRNLYDPLKDPFHHHSDHVEGEQGKKDSESYVVTFQDDDDDDDEEDEDEINRRDDDDEGGRIRNVLLKSKDNNDDDDEDDDDYDYEEREIAKLVSKPILVKNNNKNHNKNHNNKRVTFKRHNNSKINGKNKNGCQRLVVGGKQYNTQPNNQPFNIRCFTMLVSLTTHSIFEGLSVGLMDGIWPTIHISFSILFHQLLVSLAVGISLSRHRLTNLAFVSCALVFALSIPLGVVLGMVVTYGRRQLGEEMDGIQVASSCLQALTVGTFLYVLFVEVLPSETDKQQDIPLKVLLLIVGFTLVGLPAFLLP